jgi:hypothetical protein
VRARQEQHQRRDVSGIDELLDRLVGQRAVDLVGDRASGNGGSPLEDALEAGPLGDPVRVAEAPRQGGHRDDAAGPGVDEERDGLLGHEERALQV